MAVNLKCSEKSHAITKCSYSPKPLRSDGLVVQVHHTVGGSRNPIRFLRGAFHSSENILAVTDAKGNIFLIDLTRNKFWSLPNVSVCTAISFTSYDRNEIIVGSSECTVKLINFENGKEIACLKGHTVPPTQLSCGGDEGKMLLSSASGLSQCSRTRKEAHESHRKSTGEVILWDLSTRLKAHCLNVLSDCGIKQAIFLPGVSQHCILAMFDDDTICGWKLGDLDHAKIISPQSKNENNHLKTIACTRNGRAMVVGGKSHSLVVYSLDTWEAMKVIELPDEVCGVRQMEFLPEPFDGGSNHVLAVLSYDGCIHFLDLNSSCFIWKIMPERNQIFKLLCSSSGCYIACILQSGEVNIYCGSFIISSRKAVKLKVTFNEEAQHLVNSGGKITHQERNAVNERRKTIDSAAFVRNESVLKKSAAKVKEQVKSELSPNRLRLLLRHHGAFPTRYRIVAWRTVLLQLPYNSEAFVGLMSRGIHPAYVHIEQKYPLENRSEIKHLKKLMSCLAHWSPLFSQVNYLPLFAYPFVKLFIHDILGCFEAVATILINYCQHWFEFFPFPPINVLAAVENLLSYHDASLLSFFVKNGVDTREYAWPLLQVAFSEVLSNEEWIQLWDHVLVNEPSFILSAVPAYCIVCRAALLKCKNMDDFQFFFRNQNPVDMKKFISKTYCICQNTPSEFHPRQYLHKFQPLPKGDTYPVFSQYPKILVDASAEKLKRIQMDEEALISEEREIRKLLQEREEEKMLAENAVLRRKYLDELEKAYEHALKMEEDKVCRRKMELLNLKWDGTCNSLPGKTGGLKKQRYPENSPSCLDEHSHLSSQQKRNKGISSSAKIFAESPKGRHSNFYPSLLQGSEFQGLRNPPQEHQSVDCGQDPRKSEIQDDNKEGIHFDSSEGEEEKNLTERGFLLGSKYHEVQCKPTLKKVQRNTIDDTGTDAAEALGCSKRQDVNFSKRDKKKRWEIDRNVSKDSLWKYLDNDADVDTKKGDEIYKKERDAIKRAMEARIKVCLM